MINKLLTVSVAAYNVEKYINETLEIFFDNSYSDTIEVLVIDDGGTDNTKKIVETYAEQFPSIIKVVHKSNGGWGSTVNTGIELATGKYFKLLDGDDFYDKNELDKLLDFLKESDVDLVLSPYYRYDEVTKKITKIIPYDSSVIEGKIYQINDGCNYITNMAMHGCVFRTDVLKNNNVKITEKCFYTDVEYLCKGISFCKSVSFLDTPLYMYRVSRNGQSVSIEGVKKHYSDYLTVTKNLIGFYRDQEISAPVKTILHDKICELIAAYYGCLYILEISKTNKSEIIKFDKKLKHFYPEFYNSKSKFVNICRKLRFRFYPLCSIWRRKTFSL